MAHVATLMADGSPHVSPVWIEIEGDRLAIFSIVAHLKVRNMRRDPRVGDPDLRRANPYPLLVIRGRVVEEIEDEARARNHRPDEPSLPSAP